MNPGKLLRPIVASAALTLLGGGVQAAEQNLGARIGGRAILEGKAPPEKVLPLKGDCAKAHAKPPTTRFYAVSADGGLADVVVRVAEGLPDRRWRVPAQAQVIRQAGCIFEPYVSAVQAGQTVVIHNAGAEMHNVHLTSLRNPERNYAQMPGGKLSISLAMAEESVRLKCDVHPWEFAYLTVVEHPFFAVTDQNGEFSLPPLPPGEYLLEAKHRKAGTVRQKVEVKSREASSVEFRFKVVEDRAELR